MIRKGTSFVNKVVGGLLCQSVTDVAEAICHVGNEKNRRTSNDEDTYYFYDAYLIFIF